MSSNKLLKQVEAVRSLRKSGMKLEEVIHCFKYTVEQVEAVRSLRKSGMKKEEVIHCFINQQSEEAKHQASTSAVMVEILLVGVDQEFQLLESHICRKYSYVCKFYLHQNVNNCSGAGADRRYAI